MSSSAVPCTRCGRAASCPQTPGHGRAAPADGADGRKEVTKGNSVLGPATLRAVVAAGARRRPEPVRFARPEAAATFRAHRGAGSRVRGLLAVPVPVMPAPPIRGQTGDRPRMAPTLGLGTGPDRTGSTGWVCARASFSRRRRRGGGSARPPELAAPDERRGPTRQGNRPAECRCARRLRRP